MQAGPGQEQSWLRYAGLAGICYLIIIVTGIFSEVFVRSGIIVSGDAAATASNLLSSRALFRAGFFADCLMLVSDVMVAILLYEVLKPAGRTLSSLAAAFRLTQAAVLALNLLHYYGAMILLTGGTYAEVISPESQNGIAALLLEIHAHGYDLGLIFFAFTCGIQGYLIVKANYIPTWLGYGLIASGIVYIVGSFARFLTPDLVSALVPIYIVPLVAELSFCIWLISRGLSKRSRVAGS